MKVELRALDENFVPVGKTKLKYFDLAWNRKYYETGEFSVQILASDYDKSMKYIFTDDRPEMGMIQKMEYSDDDSMVVLSGYFCEGLLADKIVYPMFEQYGSRMKFVADAVDTYKADIPKLAVATYVDSGDSVRKQETGATLETMAHETLQIEEMGYRCRYDFEEDIMYFEMYKGIDRTQSQTENNFVVFSKGFKNLREVTAEEDESNYKNYFVVGGTGEGDERIYATLDLSGGEYQRQLFIDAKSKSYNTKKQTLAEYKEVLIQTAREKAEKYVKIENIEFDADTNAGAKYLTDYDLGDKCDVVIEPLGLSYEARIIEILESWSKGEHTVTLTFGDKIPTQYEKARIH
jgi:hypothetical protein